ncbi:MAG: hypothetical protein HUJ30_08425 [Gammaproteobacteria bacterium]|nr:hypothetical protein [Gammaproteobacteria bacterium]
MDTEKHKQLAEIINAYRIIPRLLLLMYGLVCYDVYQLATDPGATELQASFAKFIWGGATVWMGFYAGTGGKK